MDSKAFSERFYQSDYQACYSEETTDITTLPSDAELNALKASNFKSKRICSPYIRAAVGRSFGSILDYGCSWGYSVFKLKLEGYNQEGYEISCARAAYGGRIGITIHSKTTAVRDQDVVLSSHTIEHLTVVSDFINFAKSKLWPDGIFMAFCPNGSPEFRKRRPEVFHVNWGLLHPNYLDIDFTVTAFARNPYLVLTDDWTFDLNTISSWDGKSQVVGPQRDGEELLIIAKPNVSFE